MNFIILFIALSALVSYSMLVLASNGIAGCAEPIRSCFAGPLRWSTLTVHESFSASARCLEPTNMLKFERNSFLKMIATDSENTVILFKRLAETLGKRLIETYPTTV